MARSSNFRSSVGIRQRSRTSIQGQSIQELVQGMFSGELGTAIGRVATFPQPDAHGSSFAAYFPAPAVLIVLCSENDDVERSAR